MGIEAVSRGGGDSVLVELNQVTLSTLRKNCEARAAEKCRIVAGSGIALPEVVTSSGAFDLVFADPPYDFGDFTALLESIAAVLKRTGEAAIEHSSRVGLPVEAAGLQLLTSRRYGESKLSYYRFPAAED